MSALSSEIDWMKAEERAVYYFSVTQLVEQSLLFADTVPLNTAFLSRIKEEQMLSMKT